MKRLLLIALLFANGLVVKAQSYHPFPTDNATWSQITLWYNVLGGPVCGGTEFYGVSGDTLINTIPYSKFYGINHNGTTTGYIAVNHFVLDTATYLGGLREDSSKKVYMRYANDTIERLVYDFGMSIGDTVCPYYAGNCFEFVLDNVDSIEINGEYRKVYNLFWANGNMTWIEGIGNALGWFEFPFVGSVETYLSCFSQSEHAIYGDSTGCSCSPYWLSTIQLSGSNQSEVYPNPVSNVMTIDFQQYEDITVFGYNTLGQQVFQKSFVNSKNIQLDFSGLLDGTYLLVYNNGKDIYKEIIVKQ